MIGSIISNCTFTATSPKNQLSVCSNLSARFKVAVKPKLYFDPIL